MSAYVVQPGDTPMSITSKFLGSPERVADLVRANVHKPFHVVNNTLTFRELRVGEPLRVPAHWQHRAAPRAGVGAPACPHGFVRSPNGQCVPDGRHTNFQKRGRGVRGGRGVGQPRFEVAPSVQNHEPILTVSGPSHCCDGCANGEPCKGCGPRGSSSTLLNPASRPKGRPSIPGSTSFPVGFGQGPITTQSPYVAMVSSWGVPLAIGLAAAAAGFGAAYWLTEK